MAKRNKALETAVHVMLYLTIVLQGAALFTLWSLLDRPSTTAMDAIKVAVVLVGFMAPFLWTRK